MIFRGIVWFVLLRAVSALVVDDGCRAISRFTVVNPLDACPELCQSEMDLNVEDDVVVCLPAFPWLRLCAPGQRGQIRTHIAQGRKFLLVSQDPLWYRIATTVTPELDLKD